MPTFAEIMANLNTGLGNLNSTPMGQFGTQMLMASGPQAGNPGGGARLGQALSGMQQMQGQQQQMQQQMQLRQIQEQEMALRARALSREERKDQTMEQVLNDPSIMGQLSPQQQMAAKLGTPMADVMKIGQSKQPTPPGMVDMPQPDGTYKRRVWNAQTQQYDESVPFLPPSAQTAGVAQERLAMDKQYKPQEMNYQASNAMATAQNADTAAQRVATQQAKEQRESDKLKMESKFKRLEFKQAYRGATTELGEVAQLARDIAKDKALPRLYGPNGYIPPVAGTDAADLQVKIDRLVAKSGLTELTKLAQNGVKLTPVSNVDLAQAQSSALNASKLQSDVQARETFENYAKTMQKAMDEAATRYNEYDSLYDVPGSTQQNLPQAPTAITDDAGYNALPSGAQFTGPDGVLRRKP